MKKLVYVLVIELFVVNCLHAQTVETFTNSSIEKARSYILTENINDAIASYARIITIDSNNAALLAEDAYALALGGIYDAALMRLDRSWSIAANCSDVNYFTSQIYCLMGYDDLAAVFWKASEEYKIPAWISSNSTILLQKFKRKFLNSTTTNRKGLLDDFKHANELAAQNLYFQSIALFHKIINLYPNEYLPYVGYSIALEKTGAFEKSVQTIERAISIIENNAEGNEKKQFLEQRLVSIKQKMITLPPDAMPGLSQTKVLDIRNIQMMAYAGGMVSPTTTNLNGRLGYYISGSSNASLDFGKMNISGTSYSNLGFSFYNREKNSAVVEGFGLLMSSVNGKTAYYFKISLGYSIMNKSQTSSFDIFLDGNMDVTKFGEKGGSPTTMCLSIGTSIYFGIRK